MASNKRDNAWKYSLYFLFMISLRIEFFFNFHYNLLLISLPLSDCCTWFPVAVSNPASMSPKAAFFFYVSCLILSLIIYTFYVHSIVSSHLIIPALNLTISKNNNCLQEHYNFLSFVRFNHSSSNKHVVVICKNFQTFFSIKIH